MASHTRGFRNDDVRSNEQHSRNEAYSSVIQRSQSSQAYTEILLAASAQWFRFHQRNSRLGRGRLISRMIVFRRYDFVEMNLRIRCEALSREF